MASRDTRAAGEPALGRVLAARVGVVCLVVRVPHMRAGERVSQLHARAGCARLLVRSCDFLP